MGQPKSKLGKSYIPYSIRFLSGFTLAEVLITLGVIGVVAAITLPSLKIFTQGKQFQSGFKKTLSVISQAVALNVSLSGYDFSQAYETNQSLQTDGKSASVYNIFKKRTKMLENLNNDAWQSCSASFGASNNYTIYFNDGAVLTFEKSAASCTKNNPCYGVIDVNGRKNPNKTVACDSTTSNSGCIVSVPTDIFPVKLYDRMIMPATEAGMYVLYGDGKPKSGIVSNENSSSGSSQGGSSSSSGSSGSGSSGGSSSGSGSSGGGSSGGGLADGERPPIIID